MSYKPKDIKPSDLCKICKRRRDRHTKEEVRECEERRIAMAGESAGTRHTRK